MNAKCCRAILAAAICIACTQARGVNFLTNGDFQTGNLNGWTTFTTPNGTNGTALPDVVLFDTDNDGIQSLSARFNVGQVNFGGSRQGGGVYQQVNLAAGSYLLSANAALLAPVGNGDGGLVELMLDGIILASHDFGAASAGIPEYAFLAASPSVTAGIHEVRIRLSRAFTSNTSETPFQYVDNLTLVPEPSTLSLLLLAGLATAWRRNR